MKKKLLAGIALLFLIVSPVLAQEDGTQLPKLEVITPQNAGRLQLISTLGRGPVTSLFWLPQQDKLALTDSVGTWLYDFDSQNEVSKTWAKTETVLAISLDGNFLAATQSGYMAIEIWDVKDAKLTKVISPNDGIIQSAAFSPDRKILATGGYKGAWQETVTVVKLWNLDTGIQVGYFESKDKSLETIPTLAFNADGNELLVGGNKGAVHLLDIAALLKDNQGVVLPIADIEQDDLYSIAQVMFDPKDDSPLGLIYTLHPGGQRNVELMNLRSGKVLFQLAGSDFYELGALAITRDASLLAAPTQENHIQIWDTRSNEKILDLAGHTDTITQLAFNTEGTLLVSSSRDGTARLWDIKTGRELTSIPGFTTWVDDGVFSPDNRLLASADEGGTWHGFIRLWDVKTGLQKFITEDPNDVRGWPKSIAFNFQNTLLASGWSTGLRVWRLDTMTEIPYAQTCDALCPNLNDVTFSPDGSMIAGGSEDRKIILWNTKTAREIGSLSVRPQERITSLAFSPDGTRLVSGINGGFKTVIWDVVTLTKIAELSHPHYVDAVAYSPDGKYIATAAEDYQVRIWDAQTYEELHSLIGHHSVIWSLAFNPSSDVLASGSGQGGPLRDIRLWEVKSGAQLALLQGNGTVRSVEFSPDGTLLASGGWDGTVRLWGVPAN